MTRRTKRTNNAKELKFEAMKDLKCGNESDVEQKRAEIIKLIRETIRLKCRLAAKKEINETLPAALEAFDKGEMPKLKLTVDDLFKDL